MDYLQLITDLKRKGASDLHLEPGLLPTARLQGGLKPVGAAPLTSQNTRSIADDILNRGEWETFTAFNAVDLSATLGGVHCRVNVMKTQRGIGLAIRLLSTFQPTIERLNLHPDLKELVKNRHGLIVVCGPTGSGKSSTVAALVHEINTNDQRHIVTIESPIEYSFLPRKSFIRQREVGRDTPSFERALIDALRQDPDVIMVGEMRDREIIKLTLNAAETGQLVLTTLHSSNTAEALQRMVAAFPSEIQDAVSAQLADCLVAIVAQSLHFNEKYGIRVPLCEILAANHPVKHLIRQKQFFKIASALETGHTDGNWTFRRYQNWLDRRDDFFVPTGGEAMDPEPPKAEELSPPPDKTGAETKPGKPASSPEDVIVIEEPDEKSLGELLEKLGDDQDEKDS